MKKASGFEIVAARCWNLLNEGKPFTPIFTVTVYALYHMGSWGDVAFWAQFGLGLLAGLPLFALYFYYDFPLFLRNYLWLPVVAALVLWRDAPLELGLYALGVGLFLFFTIYFWGTFYYHLRIGTSWWNFKRFWKLVLKNSDSTSGNAQEQLPKFLLLLFVVDTAGAKWMDAAAAGERFRLGNVSALSRRDGRVRMANASQFVRLEAERDTRLYDAARAACESSDREGVRPRHRRHAQRPLRGSGCAVLEEMAGGRHGVHADGDGVSGTDGRLLLLHVHR